jgi:DNA-binding NarL/FixJ family response regulator
VPDVLIASDESWVREEVRSVLSGRPDITVREVATGVAAVAAVREREPDLAVLDSQIGNMGGLATCSELRLDESADRIDHVPVLILLDRRADVFLARRTDAEGFIVKPLDPIRLRRAITAVLDGGTYEDPAYAPVPVLVAGGASGEQA